MNIGPIATCGWFFSSAWYFHREKIYMGSLGYHDVGDVFVAFLEAGGVRVKRLLVRAGLVGADIEWRRDVSTCC